MFTKLIDRLISDNFWIQCLQGTIWVLFIAACAYFNIIFIPYVIAGLYVVELLFFIIKEIIVGIKTGGKPKWPF